MATILLAALNARYIHSSYAIRSLFANMGDLQEITTMREFTIEQRAVDIAEEILAQKPQIVAMGLYIWNIRLANELVPLLKQVAPTVTIIVGGPECYDQQDLPPAAIAADLVMAGEGEELLPILCQKVLAGEPTKHFTTAIPVDLNKLLLPYHLYTDEDLMQRVIYLESSRGCAQGCEYCTSSIEHHVRQFPLEKLFPAWLTLLDRGARQLKFLDRSLHLAQGIAILQFFLDNYRPGLFLHFEINPDTISPRLWEMLQKFPAGTIQLEVGLQTLNDEINRRIGRHQRGLKSLENIGKLEETGLFHVHTDLIFGLPEEDVIAFGENFDRLWRAHPEEIQIGHLKRLRGTPLARHPWDESYVFAPEAPYELLHNRWLTFAEVQQLRRLARLYDLVVNNGHFPHLVQLLLGKANSPFQLLWQFTAWFFEKHGQPVSIARARLSEIIQDFLQTIQEIDPEAVAAATHQDVLLLRKKKNEALPARQAAHQRGKEQLGN